MIQDAPADVEPLQVLLQPHAAPYRAKARKYSPDQIAFMDKYITQLLDAGCIRPNSHARWACATQPVRKPGTDEYRITVDYRPVNALTLPISGNMPNLPAILPKTQGAVAFATFDLFKGFWQMPLHAESQDIFQMGHIPAASMTAVCAATTGGPNGIPKSIACDDCIRGKLKHNSVPKIGDRPSHPLGTCVHTDLWGPAKVASPNGAKYFIAFTEDATNYVWVKFLTKKSDGYDDVIEYIPWLERQTGVKLKTLRSDGGGEYVSDKLKEYFKNHGIHHEVSTPRRQWQNGTAERMNRTLVEMARTILLHANTAKHWWAEAVNTAAFLRNRIPNSKTDDKTPHEMIRGTKPKIASLKVFGCLCWRRNTATDKIASRANMCTFLGYSETKKAYKVYDMEEQK
ncbi:hypothetical protein LEN26_015639, partial [Aphanomyces euteiches]